MKKEHLTQVSVFLGLLIYVGTYLSSRLDPDMSIWFLVLGAAAGTWLISYPLFMRHFMEKNATK